MMSNTEREFIRIYNCAVKLNLSIKRLSQYLGITTDSLQKKVRGINKKFGVTLKPLNKGTDNLSIRHTNTLDSVRLINTKKSSNIRKNKIFLITSAQNATPIHKGFFKACLNYCKYRSAQLLIIPYRYKNPTSLWSESNAYNEWWADDLIPFLITEKISIVDNLTILANIKVVPTNADPLSGLESFSGMNSNIVGHPKVALKSVATLNGKPKLLLTTGAITMANYTDSKTGQKAAFHHSLAAAIVEVDEQGNFHVRHVHASEKDGSFYDLDKYYTQSSVTGGHKIEALITGDTHAEFIDSTVEHVTYHSKDSIVQTLKPKRIILHDVVDFYARNHHHKNNDVIAFIKHNFCSNNNVQEGLQKAANFIDRICHDSTQIIIAKSNHDESFDRWLREADIRNDPENAKFFYYMKYHQLNTISNNKNKNKSFDPFKFWCLNPENGIGLKNKNNVIFLNRDESYKVCGIELGFHGDVGINGSRGDIKGLSKLSDKMVIGHSHTPGIYEGCYQVGLSAIMNLEYKRGPSSWMHTHCIIYPDGKRTLINIINGKWKA